MVELVLSLSLVLNTQAAELPRLLRDGQLMQCRDDGLVQFVLPLPEAYEPGGGPLRVEVAGQELPTMQATLEAASGENRVLVAGPLPAGGPYRILVSQSGRTLREFQDIYVGELFLLAGQSNMHGTAPLVEREGPVEGLRLFNFAGSGWEAAALPDHRLLLRERDAYLENYGDLLAPWQRERVMSYEGDPDSGHLTVGPGFFFARALQERLGRPVGLVPCAWGGSALDQWMDEPNEMGAPALFSIMKRRLDQAGGRVRACLWYQGESDALLAQELAYAESYEQRFPVFLTKLREVCRDPELPLFTVQIGRLTPAPVDDLSTVVLRGWEIVREKQRLLAREQSQLFLTTAVDQPLSDWVHVGFEGQRALGRRLARQVGAFLTQGPEAVPGPRLADIGFLDEARTMLYVDVENARGGLRAAGRPTGFALRRNDHKPLEESAIYDVRIDPDNPARILILCKNPLPPETMLIHGPGPDPYVNITDADGFPLPCFGPLPLVAD